MFNKSIQKLCQAFDFYWHLKDINFSQWDVEQPKQQLLQRQQR
ncbi:hypothetical protein ACFSJY_17130 [Thalassotalea euphylliae]